MGSFVALRFRFSYSDDFGIKKGMDCLYFTHRGKSARKQMVMLPLSYRGRCPPSVVRSFHVFFSAFSVLSGAPLWLPTSSQRFLFMYTVVVPADVVFVKHFVASRVQVVFFFFFNPPADGAE